MIKKTISKYWFTAIAVVFAIVWMIYSYNSPQSYFSVSPNNILTLLIALVVSYWFTLKRNNNCRAADATDRLLSKLDQRLSSNDVVFFGSSITNEEILMNVRYISNNISALEKYAEHLGFQKEYKLLNDQFKDYETRLGDHINDREYLQKTSTEFKRNINNLTKYSEDIRIFLFCK